MTGLRYKLTAYEPDGDRLGELPDPSSLQFAGPLNDLSSLTLGYHPRARRHELLNQPVEIALQLAREGEEEYTEYAGMRFLRLRSANDDLAREGLVNYTMPSYGWVMKKVRNIRYTLFDDQGKRNFSASSPGNVLLTLINEARDRGNVPQLDYSFTSSLDSNGDAWATSLTMGFDAGQDLFTTLMQLTDQGVVDWTIVGRQLQVYNANGALNLDKSTGPDAVSLFYGRDLVAAPDDASYEALAGRVLVQGDNGIYLDMPNSGALTPWGIWEDYLTQSGVSDVATMQVLAQSSLDKTADKRVQMTREIRFPSAHKLPYLDYRPGDHILAPNSEGVQEKLRIRQVTLTADTGNRLGGNLVLNDRFLERDIMQQRKLAGITGGIGMPGGSGGRPVPEGEDGRTPSAPENLVLGTTTYIDGAGRPQAQVSAAWDLVDTATTGGDMQIDRYAVELRRNEFGLPWQEVTRTTDPDNTATMGPLDINTSYAVRVRAIGHNDIYSGPSEVETILTLPDTTPPPEPSDPTTSVRLGVISVVWDGLAFNGAGMVADFDHVNVYMAPGGTNDWAMIGTLYRAGTLVVPGQPYGEARDFRLTAVDNSGNESGPSGIASATPEPLNPSEILTPGSIGYELLADNAVRDRVLQDGAISSSKIATGAVIADKLNARAVTAEKLAIGGFENAIVDPGLTDPAVNDVREVIASTGTSSGWTATYGYTFPVGRKGYQVELTGTQPASGTLAWIMPLQTGADATPVSLNDLRNSAPENFYAVEDLTEVTYRCQVYRANYSAASSIDLYVVWYYRRADDTRYTLNAPLTAYPGPGASASDVSTYTYVLDIDTLNASDPDNPVTHILPLMWIQLNLAANPGMEQGAEFGVYDFELPMFGFGSTLIQNGAITTGKIAANAITADNLMVGSVTAGAIAADAIKTTQLDADAITSKHTITGATIQTTATASRGLKITSTGMTGYSSSGQVTLSYSAASGDMTATGQFQSGIAGQRAILSNAVYPGRAGVQFHTGLTSRELQPCIFGESSSAGGSYGAGALVALSAETTINNSGRAALVLQQGMGGVKLATEYGDYKTGIESNLRIMNIWGEFTGAHDTDDLIRAGYRTSAGSSAGTVPWPVPPRSGEARPVITPLAAATRSFYVSEIGSNSFAWACNASVSGIFYMAFQGGAG